MVTVNVEFYRGVGVDDIRLPEPIVLPPGLDVSLIQARRLSIVDDIVDSGGTLELLVHMAADHVESIRSASWIYKGSPTRPDFFATQTKEWVVAPWSPHSPLIERSPGSDSPLQL